MCENNDHNYATKECPNCGKTFCYDCCKSTNVDQGGKHEPDYMLCPNCGHDYYLKKEMVIDLLKYINREGVEKILKTFENK